MVGEADYIRVTNAAKLDAALAILRDVLTGDQYGATTEDLVAITEPMYQLSERLRRVIVITDDE